MGKIHRETDMKKSPDEKVLDMFNLPSIQTPSPGMANYSVHASAKLSEMLKEAHLHGKDRHQVVAELNRLTGLDINKKTLDKWASASSTDHNVPFYLVPVIEAICEETDLCDWHASLIGGQVTYGVDTLNTRLGKLRILQNDLSKKIRDIEHALGEFE